MRNSTARVPALLCGTLFLFVLAIVPMNDVSTAFANPPVTHHAQEASDDLFQHFNDVFSGRLDWNIYTAPPSFDDYTDWEAPTLIGPDPEWELSFGIASFEFEGVDGIYQKNVYDDAITCGAMRSVSKEMIREVLAGTSPLAVAYQSGLLKGIEIDYASPSAGFSPPSSTGMLSDVVILWHQGPLGGAVPMAYVFGYTDVDFAARRSTLETIMGTTMEAHRTWLEAVVMGRHTGDGVLFNGDNSLVFGDVASAGGIRLEGDNNVTSRRWHYSSSVVDNGVGNTSAGQVQGPFSQPPAYPLTLAELQSLAIANNTYYTGSVTFDAANPPPNGVIYATGGITVSGTGLTGTCTFVAETLDLTWNATNCDFQAAANGMLLYADAQDIEINGQGNSFVGMVASDQQTVTIDADDNRIQGYLWAHQVVVDGNGCHVSDGTDPAAQ